jgi:hypothetical protein
VLDYDHGRGLVNTDPVNGQPKVNVPKNESDNSKKERVQLWMREKSLNFRKLNMMVVNHCIISDKINKLMNNFTLEYPKAQSDLVKIVDLFKVGTVFTHDQTIWTVRSIYKDIYTPLTDFSVEEIKWLRKNRGPGSLDLSETIISKFQTMEGQKNSTRSLYKFIEFSQSEVKSLEKSLIHQAKYLPGANHEGQKGIHYN